MTGQSPPPATAVLPRLGASVALWRGEELLLVKRGKAPMIGKWSLPGGHVEPGETLEAAAKRELFEETGLLAGALAFAQFHEIIRHDDAGAVLRHFVVAVFAGRFGGGIPVAGDDAADVGWYHRSALDDVDATPGTIAIALRARDLADG